MGIQRRNGGAVVACLARGVARPGLLLVLQAIVLFTLLESGQRLEAVRHADTPSYFKSVSAESWTEVLSHYRSYGYPLFLETTGRLGFSNEAVPEIQTGLFLLATLFFWLALERYTVSPWLAFAAATPLLYAPIAAQSGLIQPDLLAAAVVITAVGLVMLLAAGSRSPLVWAALGFAVFIAYQIRPATLFLIAWIPAIAWLLRVVRDRRLTRKALAWAGGLALLTILPYLAFASLRWFVVGHFGLVPFGGANLGAVTAFLVDGELIRGLPNDERRLAREIYRVRSEHQWEPLIPGGRTADWFAQYNDTLWRITYPAAWERVRLERRTGASYGRPARVEVNDRLSRLARMIIARRPYLYLQWVRDSTLHGLGQLADFGWIRWPLVVLLLLAILAWIAGVPGGSLDSARLPLVLLAVAVSYFLVHLLLVAAVSFPFLRYMRSMVLFLPSALCVLLWEGGRLWLAHLRGEPRMQ